MSLQFDGLTGRSSGRSPKSAYRRSQSRVACRRRLNIELLERRRVLASWSGDIPDGTVWTNAEIQQIVGTVRVPAGATLTVQPGTIVKTRIFSEISIQVEGRLIADGTATQPILFTSHRDDTGFDGALNTADDQDTNGDGPSNGNFGDWNRIEFKPGSIGNVLNWTNVRFAGNSSSAAVVADNAGLLLANSLIRNSSTSGVRIQSSNPTLTSNTFQSNAIAAISMDLGSNPAISGVVATNNGSNALILDTGSLVGNAFWNDPDIAYRLSGDVTVPQGSTLTVGAGQVVKFRTFFPDDLLVDGTLIADATPAQPIVFTSDRDDSAGGDTNNNGISTGVNGDWGSVQLRTGSSNHLLDNVEIRFGGGHDSVAGLFTAVPMTLSNSTIRNSSTSGVRIQSSNPTLTSNTFQSNAIAAISMDLGSNPAISGVVATNNGSNALVLDTGSLVGNAFWNDPDIVYRLSGDVTVPQGSTLTVGAGQVVKFRTFFPDDLLVDGTLIADATPAQPIVFTSDRDDSAGGDTNNNGISTGVNGDWGSVQLRTGSSNHLLDNVEILFGGGHDSKAGLFTAVPMTLSNSLIRNSSTSGVRIQSSNPTLTSNTFQSNAIAAISMDLASNPAISGVVATNNGSNALVLDTGSLVGNAFWNDPDIVYRLSGDVIVPQGSTLTVGAGQVVKFRTFLPDDLLVDGTLIADATPAQPIVFTSDRDDSAGGDTNNNGISTGVNGDWGSVQLRTGSSNHLLDNVEIRFGGGHDSVAGLFTAVPMTLSNSTIRDSSTSGVRIQSSNPTLTSNTFQSNAIAAISMDLASNPAISGVVATNNGSNALVLDTGSLVGNAFWNDPDIVYRLSGDVTVPQGSTLTVGAGQVVKFRTFFPDDLLVDGTLMADATPAQPIVFTSDRDDSAGGDTNNNGISTGVNGDWGSVQLRTGSSNHLLDNVEIRFGGGHDSKAGLFTAVPMTLSNSTIRNSSTSGVRIQSSNPTLTSNTFQSNAIAAISMDLASNPAISGVVATNNGSNALVLDTGSLVGNAFWNDPDIVYRLSGDVIVPQGSTLTVGAGQVVKFRTFLPDDLLVDGTLIADATPAQPIVFTSDRDDSAGGDTNNNGISTGVNGDWGSVQLRTGSSNHLLDNVEIRFGGGHDSVAGLFTAVPMTLSNSLIRNSSTSGVRIQSSNPTLTSNTFQSNAIAAISMDLASNPAISGVVATNNGSNALVLDTGSLVGNAFWNDPDIVYRLSGDVTVPQGSTLTVGAGQVVKFRTFLPDDLLVDGTLIADATPAQPIVFTSDRDDSAGGDTNNNGISTGVNGDWGSVQLRTGSSNHLLDNVDIRFGGGGGLATVIVEGGSLTVTESLLRNSYSNAVAVRSGASLAVSDSVIRNNFGAGIRSESGSSAAAINNTFEGNSRGFYAQAATVDIRGNVISRQSESGIQLEGNTTNAIANNVLDANTIGISVTDTTTTIVNNTIVNNQIGVMAGGNSNVTLVNNIIAQQTRSGVSRSPTAQITLEYNDVYNPRASVGNFEGVSDPKGANGNISADPLFFNRGRTGDYRLFKGSPAIDAGLSARGGQFTAPTTDLLGNPRFDDPGVVPNTGAGPQDFFDLGAYERQEVTEPDANLSVALDPVPENVIPGQRLTISWVVTNHGPNQADASWSDVVEILADPLARPRLILQEVIRALPLEPGQSYRAQTTIEVPGLHSGNYRFQVTTDARGQVFEAQFESDNVAQSAVVRADVPTLELGVPVSGLFQQSGDMQWFKVLASDRQNLRLSLDRAGTSGRTELFAARNAAPSFDNHDVRAGQFGGPDVSLDITNAEATYYYILLHAAELGGAAQSYQLVANTFDFSTASLTVNRGGNAGSVTTTILGQGLPRDATASLRTATGQLLNATSVRWLDATRLVATFNLQGAAPGVADIIVGSGTQQRTLTGAFTVQAGGQADFTVSIDGAQTVRVGRKNEFTLRWKNHGNIDAPVHLVKLNSSSLVPFTIDAGGEVQPNGFLFLAMSDQAATPVIPPGYEGELKFYVTSTDAGDFTLSAQHASINDPALDAQTIDWDAIKPLAKPAELSDAEWTRLFQQLVLQLGTTWGQMARVLAANSLQVLRQAPSAVYPQSPAVGLRPGLLTEISEAEAALATGLRAAAASTSQGRVRAFVATARKYGGEGDLRGTEYDFRNVRGWLGRAEVLESNTTVVSDNATLDAPSGEPVKADAVRNGVQNYAASLSAGDTAFMYFSGHGARSGTLQYPDGEYSYAELVQTMASSQSGRIVIVVDACFSGELLDVVSDLPTDQQGRFTIVASSTDSQTSQDAGIFGGVFTSAFFGALRDLANDKNKDGVVSIQEAYAAVPRNIGKTLYGLQLIGHMQNPQYQGDDAIILDPAGKTKDRIEDKLEVNPPIGPNKTVFRGRSGRANDPNDKASSGFGNKGEIQPDASVSFVIRFENVAPPGTGNELTFPAQQVIITDQLSADWDWSTLELGAIGFGPTVVEVPPGLNTFQRTVTTPLDTNPVFVRAALDSDTGLLSWDLRSIDPETREFPTDPLAGFLPLNDATKRGEGFVMFRIRPRAGLTSGAQIANTASIVFDTNSAIVTNTVVNTIDRDAPVSLVTALPVKVGRTFTVNWQGTDATGSGIRSYDIYVSIDGAAPQIWLYDQQATQASYIGEIGRNYAFYSVATDAVGNRETAPLSFDSATSVSVARWQNPGIPITARFDVTNDGFVTALDALFIINDLNQTGGRALPTVPGSGEQPPPYFDVSGDDFLSAIDALLVINQLNLGVGRVEAGESSDDVTSGLTRAQATDEVILANMWSSELGDEPSTKKKRKASGI